MRRLAVVLSLSALLLAGCTSVERTPAPVPMPTSTGSGARGYYIDCSAPVDGDGTRAHPWNSVAAIDSHGAFAPGEHILLRRGSVCSGRVTPSGSGVNGSPIVLSAYGSGASPIVNGNGTPDQTATVQLTNVHDWVVEDLTVTNLALGGPDNTMRAGIMAVNDGFGRLSNIVIRHNVVRRVTSDPGSYSADPHSFGGIIVLVRANGQTGQNTYDSVSIDDNVVDHVGRTGIAVWSNAYPSAFVTDVSVTRNTVQYAEGDSILLLGVDGGVIDHNVSANGGYLPPCPNCTFTAYSPVNAGIWPVESRNIEIRYNEVSGEGADRGDGEGFDVDETTSNVVVEGNYAHDNAGGGVLVCGATATDIRFNVFENDGGGEITFSCPTQGHRIRIFNNDIFIPAESATQVVRRIEGSGSNPILFANNIVENFGTGGYAWPSPVQATHNVFVGSHPVSQPPDTDALMTDPGLIAPGTAGMGIDSVVGYGLPASSPAAGTALPITSSARVDYEGGALDLARPSRGAFAPGSPAPPAPPSATVQAVTVPGIGVLITWPATDGEVSVIRRIALSSDGTATDTAMLLGGGFLDRDVPAGRYRYEVLTVTRSAVTVFGTATLTLPPG